jgi:hypothetical protein
VGAVAALCGDLGICVTAYETYNHDVQEYMIKRDLWLYQSSSPQDTSSACPVELYHPDWEGMLEARSGALVPNSLAGAHSLSSSGMSVSAADESWQVGMGRERGRWCGGTASVAWTGGSAGAVVHGVLHGVGVGASDGLAIGLGSPVSQC